MAMNDFMARARKPHVQLELPKLDKNGQRRGGKRPGAGRPKKGERASERHKTREAFKPNHPIHVTLRVAPDVVSLRGRALYQALRAALVTTYARNCIRICHISIQGTHIHLIVEANNRDSLARGIQGFEIAAARHINAAVTRRTGVRRTGTVFPDRYHAVIIRSPRQARSNLAYVVNNWRKHREVQRGALRQWPVDLFSSAPTFDGFADFDPRAVEWPPTYLPLPVFQPRTWLLSTGWKQFGLVRTTEVPSAKKPARTKVRR